MKESTLKVGDYVLMKQEKKNKNKLSTNFLTNPAKVIEIDGAAVTLLYNHKTYIRNAAHVKRVFPSKYAHFSDSDDSIPFTSGDEYQSDGSVGSDNSEDEAEPHIDADAVVTQEPRPVRERRAPAHFRDFVMN